MSNSIQQIQTLGQSVWYDNIHRGQIKSGELKRIIDSGITGLTSNPTIFDKAISESTDYDDSILALMKNTTDVNAVYESLVIEDIRSAADLLYPIYSRTNGFDGYASLEVNPHLAYDTKSTVDEAKRLFFKLDRPNIMMKVPATPQGIDAVQQLISKGINVNVTLTFSLEAYQGVRMAYIKGLEELYSSGGDIANISSVASFFVSRLDTAVDGLLQQLIDEGATDVNALFGKAAIANAKLAYRDFARDFAADRFMILQSNGAKPQRPLWASTSTKNPNYRDVLYVESLIGHNTVNTMPPSTISAFLDHGRPSISIDKQAEEAEYIFDSLKSNGIDMNRITDELLVDGVNLFADSYDKLIKNIEQKMGNQLP